MGRAPLYIAIGLIGAGALGGGGYWAWAKKQAAEAQARQMEEARIAEAKRVEEEAARREEELRRKLKQEEDLRQQAERERQAAQARAAEEARVRQQAELRAAEEANARRQAQAAASAAARAQEDARRAAQAAQQQGRAVIPPTTRAIGYEVASAAANRGDYRAAYNACQSPAQAGDARCQNMMGLLYVNGQIGSRTPADLRVAAEWFRRAAQQNVAPSQFNLALMYERGAGVPRDLNTARMWYARAAAQGHANAAQALARLGNPGR
jgi:TPR repeat protein